MATGSEIQYYYGLLYRLLGDAYAKRFMEYITEAGEGADAEAIFNSLTGGRYGEEYGPRIQYQAARGLGAGYWNPAQQYAANLYDPMRSLWGLQQPIAAAATGGEAPGWLDYVSRMGRGGMGAVYGKARDVYSQLMGLGETKRKEAGLGYETTYDPETGEKVPYQEGGPQPLASLGELLRYSEGRRLAGGASRWLASYLPRVQESWQGAVSRGETKETFLDYLKARYGLG